MTADKIIAAAAFNTLPIYVKYWRELTELQQKQAIARFSGLYMIDYIYCLGLDQRVIARRWLEVAW